MNYAIKATPVIKYGTSPGFPPLDIQLLGLCQLFDPPEQITLCIELEKSQTLLNVKQILLRLQSRINSADASKKQIPPSIPLEKCKPGILLHGRIRLSTDSRTLLPGDNMHLS